MTVAELIAELLKLPSGDVEVYVETCEAGEREPAGEVKWETHSRRNKTTYNVAVVRC